MQKAQKGDRIQIHYTGTLDNGSIFDSSRGSGCVVYGPVTFVLGEGDLLPRCQEALVGLEPGQSTQVRVPCREAYGPRDESLVFVTARSEIQPEERPPWRGWKLPRFNPKKGDLLEVPLMDGEFLPVIVAQVSDTFITLDANHPLAGKDLNFDIKLLNILESKSQKSCPNAEVIPLSEASSSKWKNYRSETKNGARHSRM